jgi:hypothetical protein
MSSTTKLLQRTNRFSIIPEPGDSTKTFTAFNDAGTEVEVSEFLYSFTRMIKPHCILETGTHKGISSAYFAMACEENKRGQVYTFEIIDEHYRDSTLMFIETGLINHITNLQQDAMTFDASGLSIDLLFLDSEPQLRFNEFIKFWPNVRDGGFIIIHDLHPNLGHHNTSHAGMYDWPYGYFGEKLGPFMKDHSIQTISFDTPRGLTMFQKQRVDFGHTRLLQNKIEEHDEAVRLAGLYPVKMG